MLHQIQILLLHSRVALFFICEINGILSVDCILGIEKGLTPPWTMDEFRREQPVAHHALVRFEILLEDHYKDVQVSPLKCISIDELFF